MATVVQAKRDFGSFHSSNVQELIALPEVRRVFLHIFLLTLTTSPLQEVYQPPKLPFQLPTFDHLVSFGAEMKEKHFYVDSEVSHSCYLLLLLKLLITTCTLEVLGISQSWSIWSSHQRGLDRCTG